MAFFNPSVDIYIAKSAGFAQPILIHLRKLICVLFIPILVYCLHDYYQPLAIRNIYFP
jgi:hypothetical protein